MEKTGSLRRTFEQPAWEEESGFLDFLSEVYAEAAKFDSTFDFGIASLASPPEYSDGKRDLTGNIGFVVIR